MDKTSQSSFMVIAYFSLLLLLIMSAVIDTSTKKIPNAIVLTIFIIGLCFNSLTFQGIGLWGSFIGFSVGLIIMLPSYSFAGMGAGDVKLMAAIGSVVGFNKIVDVALHSYLVIFVMSLLFIILKGDLVKLLVRYKAFFFGLFTGVISYQKPHTSEAAGQRLPLAPAILLATGYVIYPALCKSEFINHLCHF